MAGIIRYSAINNYTGHLYVLVAQVRDVLELLFLCVDIEGVEHVVHVTGHETWQVVLAEIDAVVGYAVLRVVVCADLFRAGT